MNIVIRKAERKDSAAIMGLVRELAAYEKASEQVIVSDAHFEESGFGEKPVWWAFVAESESKIVGAVIYYIRYSTWKGQRLYLEDFIVSAPFRGRGVGKALFKKLVQEAKEKTYTGIVWQVLKWNEPAINFYKKFNVTFDSELVNCSIDF